MLGKQAMIGLVFTGSILGTACGNGSGAADDLDPEMAAPAVETGAAGTGADSAWSSPSDPGVPGREDNMGVGAGSSVHTPDSAKRP